MSGTSTATNPSDRHPRFPMMTRAEVDAEVQAGRRCPACEDENMKCRCHARDIAAARQARHSGSPRVRTLRCTLCGRPDDDHDPSPCYGGGWVHENGSDRAGGAS